MRKLDTPALTGAALHYVEQFQKPSRKGPSGAWIGGRSYVRDCLYHCTFMDSYDFMLGVMKDKLSGQDEKDFKSMINGFDPRDAYVFEKLLEERLAINPMGEHVPGAIGKVQIGNRIVGKRAKDVKRYHVEERTLMQRLTFVNGTLMDRFTFRRYKQPELISCATVMRNEYWPVYAGEVEERLLDSGVADALPQGALAFEPMPNIMMATNPKISNEAAIGACNFIVDSLDEGTTAATIRGRTGAQPADVDATESGVLLFTLTMSDPAFGAASDDTGKATATASAITDDSEADTDGTLGYCRCGATGTGVDDHIDGEAGTSASDFNFDTLSISSGATISMSAFTVSVSE